MLDTLQFDAPKTKDFVAMTNNLKIADKKTLVILPEPNKFVYLSVRIIAKAKVITASELNTYEILNNKALVLTEATVAEIEQHFNA